MFTINDDMSIYVTRGDVIFFAVSADRDGRNYNFQPGEVLRIKVFEKKACENVVLEKVFPVSVESERLEIVLTKEDTKIGEVISKPVDYWYEIELNPFTNPQTIIGYDEGGPKVFRLLPEGADADDKPGGGTYDFEIVGKFDADGMFFGWQVYSAAAVNEAFQLLKEEITEETDEKLEGKADKTELEELRQEITEEFDEKLEGKADKTDLDAKADKTDLDAKADKTDLDAKADRTELEELRQDILGEIDEISALVGEVT